MKSPPIKLNWLDRAIEVQRFHAANLKEDSSWTIQQTADALNRSIGSISQDIQLAHWCKTHEKQLRRFDTMGEALKFIKNKHREQRVTSL